MDIEWAALCKAVETSDFRSLLDARITASYFSDLDNVHVFNAMLDYWSEHNASPTEAVLHHLFPAYDLIETPEPMSWYLQELRARHRYSLVAEMLDQVKDPLKQGDAATVLRIMAHGVETAHTEVSDLSDTDFTQTTEAWLAYCKTLTSDHGLRGITTGFPSMDLATAGLQPEQLVSLVGLPKDGKSMILLCMAIAAHNARRKTLFVTFEMSNEEQAMRHSAFRAGVSYNRLANGKLTGQEWSRLRKTMHAMQDMAPMVFVHDASSTTTVSGLAAKVAQHKPDVVFVDGAYMMDAELTDTEPGSAQALTSITRSLKRLAQRAHIPIVITTQALTWKARKGKLSLNSVGYSSSFGQDSDVIFGVEKGDNPEERVLKIIAARHSSTKEIRLRFDWDNGTITEMDEVVYGRDDVVDEDDENNA
jgi:replicative DNA helicase